MLDQERSEESRPSQLDHRSVPHRRGLLNTALARINRPMSMGAQYLLFFVMSVIGILIALLIAIIREALR